MAAEKIYYGDTLFSNALLDDVEKRGLKPSGFPSSWQHDAVQIETYLAKLNLGGLDVQRQVFQAIFAKAMELIQEHRGRLESLSNRLLKDLQTRGKVEIGGKEVTRLLGGPPEKPMVMELVMEQPTPIRANIEVGKKILEDFLSPKSLLPGSFPRIP